MGIIDTAAQNETRKAYAQHAEIMRQQPLARQTAEQEARLNAMTEQPELVSGFANNVPASNMNNNPSGSVSGLAQAVQLDNARRQQMASGLGASY